MGDFQLSEISSNHIQLCISKVIQEDILSWAESLILDSGEFYTGCDGSWAYKGSITVLMEKETQLKESNQEQITILLSFY